MHWFTFWNLGLGFSWRLETERIVFYPCPESLEGVTLYITPAFFLFKLRVSIVTVISPAFKFYKVIFSFLNSVISVPFLRFCFLFIL